MDKIIIRKIKLEELPRVISVTRQAFSVPFLRGGVISSFHEPENLAEMIKNKEMTVLIALVDDKIVGAVRFKPTRNGKKVHLSKLCVLKPYRKIGIGPKLIKRVEAEAKKMGYEKVKLDCMLEKELVPYYKKFGYHVYNVKKHENHHDVFMYKRIIPKIY